MICKKCGAKNKEGVNICSECGASLKNTLHDPLDDLSTIKKTDKDYEDKGIGKLGSLNNLDKFQVGYLFADRYEILSDGKRGGMGVVYKVNDHSLNKVKALKTIHPDLALDGNAILRFKQEVAISQDLIHSNIVRVYDFGESSGIQFFTMEWIDGVTLREVINKRKKEKKPFNLSEAYEIVLQIAEALEYAHRYTIHRDIKPENILLIRDIDTGKLIVKITDFGIAKMLTPSKFAFTSSQMGTPYYMAPEQKVDAAHVDKRADIYSLGVVLFELLTLENTIGLEAPSEINKDLPKEIDAIVKKAIATKPEDRYRDAKEFIKALKELIKKAEEKVEPEVEIKQEEADRPTEPLDRSRALSPQKQGKPVYKWVVFIVILLALIGFIYTYGLKKEVPKSPEGPKSGEGVKPESPSGIDEKKPEEKSKPYSKEQKDQTEKKKDKDEIVSTKDEVKKEEKKREDERKEKLKGGKVEVKVIQPDEEKRSSIVEANGYADFFPGKNIRELREEAFEDARRQVLKLAEDHTQTLGRGLKIVFVDTTGKDSSRPIINILEQKDFGIKEGKHYHVWIKAEVNYKVEKPSTISQVAILKPEAPLTVNVWTDKKEYLEGEQMRIYLQGNKPFYARIIYIDASENVIQVLPNAFRKRNFFEGGKKYTIPDEEENDKFVLEVEPPFGKEKIIVFSSTNPLGDVSMEQLDKGLYGYRGDIKTLGARSRDVRGLGIRQIEIGKPSAEAAEFYEALWQVETKK